MAKLNVQATAGFNAGKTYYARPFRVEDIIIDPEIERIFQIQDKTLSEIKEKMSLFGYDKSQPVVVEKGTNILLDGHTRLKAAKQAGLEEIPVVEMEFEDRDAAILYTYERQTLRRNLTNSEILTAAKMIPGEKNSRGKGRAAEKIAEKLKVSPDTIYKAQAILKEAPAEVLEAVKKGDMSLKKGYKAVQKIRDPNREEKPKETERGDDREMKIRKNIMNAQEKISAACRLIEDKKCLDLLNAATGVLSSTLDGLLVRKKM